MNLSSRIVTNTGLTDPDGRPLHDYRCSTETFDELEKALRSRVLAGPTASTASAFVYWAAERIRARFPGGQLTWTFVFDGLGLTEDQHLGRELAERGLLWWRREIRASDAGARMYLYSLMAEGGIPEALLRASGLYRNVVMGLLSEIENEGGLAAKHWAERIAVRWVGRLPQTFQNSDIARLLADLTLSLANLRSELPADLPEAAATRWLDKHRPGWISRIPIRITPEIAETLIHPALRAERDPTSTMPGPLCGRELRRDETGRWHGYLAVADIGWLPAPHFPGVEELRLRLLPAGASPIVGLSYSAAPEDNGWRLRRFGRAGSGPIRFSPYQPFALAAFADGRAKGEAIVDHGLPFPTDVPGFWRAVDPSEGVEAVRLIPLSGAGRTRAPCLWVLAPDNIEPTADEGVILDEIETAPGGFLWRVSGKGKLSLGERQYRIETGAAEDAPEARLAVFGHVLRGWRLDGNSPVYCGEVTICGQIGASGWRTLAERDLQYTSGRSLGGEIVEWAPNGETLARLLLFRLPASAYLDLREDAPGNVTLKAKGLANGWRVVLKAGEVNIRGDVENGAVQLKLEVPGKTPGLVWLGLSEPATGAALRLQTAWPARNGTVLDPKGERLEDNLPISVEELNGWRAIAPESSNCILQLELKGQKAVSFPVGGEISLAAYRPLIHAMLAQGGPDSQINLCLVVVGGDESKRLEIRRYHEQTEVKEGMLRAGLERDIPIKTETALEIQLNRRRHLAVHAVNMDTPEPTTTIEGTSSLDLRAHLEYTEGPWLLQPRLDGRIQRAVVWAPLIATNTTRGSRIEAYAEEWRQLLYTPDNPEWDRLCRLITAVGEGGDTSVLDQVQALAQTPAAAVALALRVPREELSQVMGLDTTSPLFWPVVPIPNFTEAVRIEQQRRQTKLSPYFEEEEAREEADAAVFKRIGEILTLQAELAGHYGQALMNAGLFERIVNSPTHQELLRPFLLSDPTARLTELSQDAARRFDWLPSGMRDLPRPQNPINSFNTHLQPVIDAPLVAAEMATGQMSAPGVSVKLTLINLRLVDPIYFDTALPAALNRLTEPRP